MNFHPQMKGMQGDFNGSLLVESSGIKAFHECVDLLITSVCVRMGILT